MSKQKTTRYSEEFRVSSARMAFESDQPIADVSSRKPSAIRDPSFLVGPGSESGVTEVLVRGTNS
jgi:hypothetical protein